MNRDGHNNARFFIGPEVEHTPAFNKRTLFVVGKQPVADIVQFAREQKTTHIFMGANHSFAVDHDSYWDTTITHLLDRGFWVSLDYEAHLHGDVLKMLSKGIWQSRIFVPMLSIRIPHLQTSSQNLTLKFDDVDFKATNAGVWCLNHHEVTDSNRFTDWQDYGSDEVLAAEITTYVGSITTIENAEEIKNNEAAGLDTVVTPGNLTPAEVINTMSTIKNDGEIGLDTVPKKAVEDVVEAVTTTPADAAEAYAEGTKPPKKTGKK
jgi:hypothetical protein